LRGTLDDDVSSPGALMGILPLPLLQTFVGLGYLAVEMLIESVAAAGISINCKSMNHIYSFLV